MIDEAVRELEERLKTIEKRLLARRRHNPWYIKDRWNVQTLIEHAKGQRAREPLYQMYDAGTNPGKARQVFSDRYGRTPREVIVKTSVVLAGPITKEEKEKQI